MTIRNFLAQARTRDRPTQRGEVLASTGPVSLALQRSGKTRRTRIQRVTAVSKRMAATTGRADRPGPALWLLPNNCGKSSIDRLVWRRPPDPPRVPVQMYRGLQVSCDLLRQPVNFSWALPDSSQPARFRDLASGMRRGRPRQPDHRQPTGCNQRQRHSNRSARGKKAKCNISISSATYGKRDT